MFDKALSTINSLSDQDKKLILTEAISGIKIGLAIGTSFGFLLAKIGMMVLNEHAVIPISFKGLLKDKPKNFVTVCGLITLAAGIPSAAMGGVIAGGLKAFSIFSQHFSASDISGILKSPKM